MGWVAVKRLLRRVVRPSSRPTFLRRFRITQRLVLCFGVTALLLVALGVFCLLQMQSIRDQGEAVESGSLPSIAMADAIAIDLIKLRGECQADCQCRRSRRSGDQQDQCRAAEE